MIKFGFHLSNLFSVLLNKSQLKYTLIVLNNIRYILK